MTDISKIRHWTETTSEPTGKPYPHGVTLKETNWIGFPITERAETAINFIRENLHDDSLEKHLSFALEQYVFAKGGVFFKINP